MLPNTACSGKNSPVSSDKSIEYDGEHRELYMSLRERVDSPLITEFFSDSRFRIYERTLERNTSYNKITVDFYKRPSFGLFTEEGKEKGRSFVQDKYSALTEAAQRFGLPKEAIWDISALAGMEYSWGRLKPTNMAFNSLASLYRDVPHRRDFATRNIEGLIEGINDPFIEIDPFAPSSFVGAVGYCQLMPFWFSYITDWSDKELLDISGSGSFDPYDMKDAIGFFAWRLKEQGYKENRFVAIRRYNGSGQAAEAFAEAIIDYADKIKTAS